MIQVSFNGRTQSLTDWAAEIGIDRTTIRKRLRAGWSIDDALNPKDTRGSHMRGGWRWPASVKRKISEGLRRRSRRLGLSGRRSFVSLDQLKFEAPIALVSDSILYADPIEILCAAEEAELRLCK